MIVEIDESKFWNVKYNRGHRVDGVWILGIVEWAERRRIILIPANDRKKETLISIIKKYVHEDSIIYTDCFRSFAVMEENFHRHESVNHSLWFVDPISGIHTNTIEGNWHTFKFNVSIKKEQENW